MRKVKGCGLGCGFIKCVIFDWCFKVREDLMSRKKMADNREKARKTRELKKYGKKVCTQYELFVGIIWSNVVTTQVQKEVLEKRRLEKKMTMDSLKKYKKGRYFNIVQL